ncbi:MAG: hypothetical protein FK731_03075 [Asgard group archaeon]|nr:hypothetical protein [Asgard group archaeon]
MAPENSLYYILGIVGIFIIVIGIIVWDQIRSARKKRAADTTAHGSPSSFDAESKTKMMTKLDKRESQIRRERILEGEVLPELSELVVYFPTKNEKIDAVEVDVRGKTAIRAIVWINNQASFVDVDGSFIGTVLLYKGKNILDIVAVGPRGRTMKTSIPVNCVAKDAITRSVTSHTYLLPDHSLEIKHDDIPAPPPSPGSDVTTIPITKKRKETQPEGLLEEFPVKTGDPIIASETEIDPSVLAALKGDTIVEETPVMESAVSLDEISTETISPEIEIPPIPDILESEDDQKLPSIPKDIVKEEEHPEPPPLPEDELEIIESVKILEEVIDSDKEAFEPDEMIPLTKKEQIDAAKPDDKDELNEIKLDEFQPLKQKEEGSQELVVETKIQELDDDRSTIILQHNGLLRNEDGELIQILKLEKRIEKIKNKWFSTLGLVNISKLSLIKAEICEYISNTMKLTDKLPVNVEEPIIDTLPEGVRITWIINEIKPKMKVFITYSEDTNPLFIIKDEQKQPSIRIRK